MISFLLTEYRSLKSKLSNNERHQSPTIIPDTSQNRLVNQLTTNNITQTTSDNIYSTSSIAEGRYD